MAEIPRQYRPNMVITTRRLILRDTNVSDECCAALFDLRSHPKVLNVINLKPPEKVEGMKDWLRWRLSLPNSFSFIVELRDPADPSLLGTSKNIIGNVGGNRTPEFGYTMHPDHWGKGYTVEAMRAVIDAFWDAWPDGMPSLPKDRRNEIVLRVSPDNAPSLAVARRLGFSEVGREVVDDKGGTLDGKTIIRFRLERPASDRPRAYEKMEIVGPNLCEGPLIGDSDS